MTHWVQRRLRRGDRLQQGAPGVLGFIQQKLTLLQRNMVIAWYQRHG